MNEVVAAIVRPFASRFSDETAIERNHVISYGNDLWAHAEPISRAMRPSARMAWVVGNAYLQGIEVPTDAYVSAIFRELGWSVQPPIVLRRRHSRSGLVESVVLLSR